MSNLSRGVLRATRISSKTKPPVHRLSTSRPATLGRLQIKKSFGGVNVWTPRPNLLHILKEFIILAASSLPLSRRDLQDLSQSTQKFAFKDTHLHATEPLFSVCQEVINRAPLPKVRNPCRTQAMKSRKMDIDSVPRKLRRALVRLIK